MCAVDPNVLARLVTRDDTRQGDEVGKAYNAWVHPAENEPLQAAVRFGLPKEARVPRPQLSAMCSVAPLVVFRPHTGLLDPHRNGNP